MGRWKRGWAGLLAAFAVHTAAGAAYSVQVVAAPVVLGDVEYFWFTALDVNNEGKSLVVRRQYGADGESYLVYDRQGRELRTVGSYGRAGGSSASSINHYGDVAGHEWKGYYWQGRVQRDQGFEAVVHGFPEGETGGNDRDAQAFGLSDGGYVAGQAVGALDGRRRGFVWRAGVMQEIGTFGGAESTARAVNDRGLAVGHADLGNGRVHALRFRSGRLTDLGTLGGANSWAHDVNASGQVAGTAERADGTTAAFRHANGVMTALPTPAGASAEAWQINRAGHMVGSYRSAGKDVPFFFDGTKVVAVTKLLSDADRTTWRVLRVAALNDKGWLLADAQRSGQIHSTVVLLKPPTAP